MRKLILLLGAVAITAPTIATAQESIVGQWRYESAACTPLAGAIMIRPLGMGGDEFMCDFDSVSRAGNTVTWTGSCGFPEPMEPTTVIATLAGSRLTVSFDGGDNGPFVRCGR